jgi:hypothetical protein
LEYYWKDPDAKADSHSVAEGVGYHSAAGMGDVAGTDYGKGPTTIPLTRRRPLLITLLKTNTQTSVTTRSLSLKPFPLGIHLLALVIHHDSAVHKRLKIGISIGHQLQL